MSRVLITAFEPYDQWSSNASWLALVELTRDLPASPAVVTRRYPVDFDAVGQHLARDLTPETEVALFLGQAPGSAVIALESIAVNVAGEHDLHPDQFRPLVHDGPAAYRSTLPLGEWAQQIRELGIPAQVSYHAGTYLCNGLMYLAHHHIHRAGLSTRAAFIHLPLAPEQTLRQRDPPPALPSSMVATALRQILALVATTSA